MTWTYVQSSGELLHNGTHVANGYAGHGEGVNNAADEGIEDVGPVPEGKYTIGDPFTHPTCGPIAMRLEPAADNQMFGRSGFLIHGDNSSLNHSASNGCIILGPAIRTQIAKSGDRALVVMARPTTETQTA